MKKYYNIPATEVVAFVGGMLMDTASPATTIPSPYNDPDPGSGASQIP